MGGIEEIPLLEGIVGDVEQRQPVGRCVEDEMESAVVDTSVPSDVGKREATARIAALDERRLEPSKPNPSFSMPR